MLRKPHQIPTLNTMFTKKFVVASMLQSFPVYLTAGKAPLFDNFEITGTWFYFSMSIQGAIHIDSETEAEVWIGGLLHLHYRYAPLTIIPVYYPEIVVPPAG